MQMPKSFQHIDLAYLESITDGSKEIMQELITIFIEQIPEFKQSVVTKCNPEI